MVENQTPAERRSTPATPLLHTIIVSDAVQRAKCRELSDCWLDFLGGHDLLSPSPRGVAGEDNASEKVKCLAAVGCDGSSARKAARKTVDAGENQG